MIKMLRFMFNCFCMMPLFLSANIHNNKWNAVFEPPASTVTILLCYTEEGVPMIGPTRKQIEKLAYEMYLARGCGHGKDVEDGFLLKGNYWWTRPLRKRLKGFRPTCGAQKVLLR